MGSRLGQAKHVGGEKQLLPPKVVVRLKTANVVKLLWVRHTVEHLPDVIVTVHVP